MAQEEPIEDTSITSHLIELRSRLLRCILAVLLIFLVAASFADQLYAVVAKPLLAVLPAGSQMIATDVASPFFTPFKLAFVVSIFAAIPYILFELWRFIAPGLFKREKRIIAPVLLASVLLFYLGIAFAYYAVFPIMFTFFSSAGPVGVSYTPDIARFLDTVLQLFFAFGIAFEVPIAIIVLAFLGIIKAQSLAQKRPYVIIACFVIGAILTPPDPISQCLMALPLWALFEIGLLIAKLFQTQSDKTENI